MPRHASRALAILGLGLLLPLGAACGDKRTLPLPRSFSEIEREPDGGSVWQGRIPGTTMPGALRPTVIYLPPRFSSRARYPVVYLLQGIPGSPCQYVFGLCLGSRADGLIARHEVPPFIAVIPPAGRTRRFTGEWTGVWEDYLVGDVVPWADRHLPTTGSTADRVLAGVSAGGFGAVDIGLRNPGVFGTLESWSGSFAPPRDGSLARAGAAELAAHDPTLLARRRARLFRRPGLHVFLSAGTADESSARAARAFADELQALGIAHRLWLGPGGHDGRFWRSQLVVALRYALTARGRSRRP